MRVVIVKEILGKRIRVGIRMEVDYYRMLRF